MSHLSDVLELLELEDELEDVDEDVEAKLLGDWLVALAALDDEPEPKPKPEPEPDAGREFVVGDILSSSWGYDQTNVTFYQVLRVTPKTVTVREIRTERKYDAEMMLGTVLPIRDSFPLHSKEKRRTVIRSFDGSRPCLKMESYEFAYLWNGNPEEFTAYA
jgi:hypothetical protein